MTNPTMTYQELTAKWAVGSGPWDWKHEAWSVLQNVGRTLAMWDSIAEDGIREPVLLGDDGRVWDGHHRIVIAGELDWIEANV